MTELLVTGGSGFLGRHVVAEFRSRGIEDIVTPRRSEYDLTDQRSTDELFDKFAPELVVHLAAEVGGIGANRDNPGRYFYANAMMGINLIESSRMHVTYAETLADAAAKAVNAARGAI